MKEGVKRITTGAIIVVIVVAVIVLNNSLIDTAFVMALSLLGMYEYNKCFKQKGYHPLSLVGYLSCLVIPCIGKVDPSTLVEYTKIIVPILLVLMFAYIIIKKLKVTIIDIAITLLSVIYVPMLFSFIKLLFLEENGRVLVSLVFLIATSTDTMAYEIGSKFGKHKLCPDVSPKKTIEGALAGTISAMVVTCVVCIVANTYFNTNFNIIILTIMGAVFSICGQIGDLAASSIKRFCSQKDFSNLLPGHGGVLDRFDSVMFIAPILYAFMHIIELIS